MALISSDEMLGARVRLSPDYDLIPFDRLDEAGRTRFRRLSSDPVWGAVLQPRGVGWRRAHLVTVETASMLRALQAPDGARPGLPFEVRARFVLDGVLELDGGEGFVSGPATYRLFFSGAVPPTLNPLGILSREALHYGWRGGLADARALAAKLYLHNTHPGSPAWRRRFPDATAVERLLEDGAGRARLSARVSWEEFTTSHHAHNVWRVWDAPDAVAPSGAAPTHKLYISPRIGAVADTLGPVLALIGAPFQPYSVKVGRDLPTLLRPDKMVAYFHRQDDLLAAAERLREELAGIPSQGVPFTAQLGSDVLFSMAADPADTAEPPGPRRQGSWRGWITARLAAAMTTARASGVDVPIVAYALDRVSLEGVDTTEWIPPSWFGRPDHRDADN